MSLMFLLLNALQTVAQVQGLTVGSLVIPWSVIVTIAGGGAAWATLRADARAAKGTAARAEQAAEQADKGIAELNTKVGKIETDIHNIWRELNRWEKSR